MISERILAGLPAARARGVVLGNSDLANANHAAAAVRAEDMGAIFAATATMSAQGCRRAQ